MPKVRIYDLAKQINVGSKELLTKLTEMGIQGKTASSSLDDDTTRKVVEFYSNKPQRHDQRSETKSQSTFANDNLQQTRVHQSHERPSGAGESFQQRPRQGQPAQTGEQRQNLDRAQQHNQPQQNQERQQGNQPRQNYDRSQQNRPPRQNQERPAQSGYQGQDRSQNNNQSRQGYQQRQGNDRPQNNQQRQGYDRPQNNSQRPGYDRPQQNNQQRQDRPNYQQRQQNPDRQGQYNQPRQNQDRPQQGSQPRQGQGFNQQNRQGQRPSPQGDQRRQDRPSGGNDQRRQSNFQSKGNQSTQLKSQSRSENGQRRPDPSKQREQQNRDRNQRKQVEKQPPRPHIMPEPKPAPVIEMIELPKTITVRGLAGLLNRGSSEIIKLLMKRGIMANINMDLDFDLASEIALEYNVDVVEEKEANILEDAFREEDDPDEKKVERPPVVVVMGHVDHGKTSLLDAIRNTKVTDTEAGGITQHIGAYTVSVANKPITFLDTPGHEAFTAMRMRGAQVTDIAILVVGADDGVMPQTIEAINHAKAANVEIIVAINKIDRPNANPDRVKQELVEYGLVAEDWGGETICVEVSALNGTGIPHLLEMIVLVAEMKELKANPDKKARGTIIEASLDKGRGPVATVLVKNGTLSIGDSVVAGGCYGRVRAMMDDRGKSVRAAGPSQPVEIIGLSEVPKAGDNIFAAQNEKQARQLAESVSAKSREELLSTTPQKVSLDDLFTQIQSGNVKDLNIIVKGDVQGSVEALKNSLERLSNSEVRIRTLHGGVGAITESDVMLASASNAIIIGFNVRPDASARAVAELEKVDIRMYRIIYNAIEDITSAMKGMLEPVYREVVIGHAEIRQLFKASGVGTIGGSYVTDGKFTRNASVRIVREGRVVYEGTLETLKRFKDDVREVATGYECGLLFTKFNDIKENDIVEAFVMEEVPR